MLSIIATPDLDDLSNGVFRITVAIEETDTLLKNRLVAGSVSWGDGSVDETIEKQSISIGNRTTEITYSKAYRPGKYVVKVRANNYRSPVADTDLFVYFVDNTELTLSEPRTSAAISIGPILPRDVGFPNAEQWNFNIGRDLETTESAIRLLLSVSKGERLMDPEYGTDLNRIIFEPDDGTGSVDGQIQQEILLAVERFAPFVNVQSISVTRVNASKRINVDIRFVALPKQQTFRVNLSFER